jgi:hypothetical protein
MVGISSSPLLSVPLVSLRRPWLVAAHGGSNDTHLPTPLLDPPCPTAAAESVGVWRHNEYDTVRITGRASRHGSPSFEV